jgi:hypothetical protein
MTITIHSTEHLTMIENSTGSLPARLWEGETSSGTPVHCYITRIAPTIPKDDPRQAEFMKELQEQRPPTVPGIPLRMIL